MLKASSLGERLLMAARRHATQSGHLHFYRSELAVVTEPSAGAGYTLAC